MDFPTRNLYRAAIEELARGSKLTELEIARGGAGGRQCIRAQTDDERALDARARSRLSSDRRRAARTLEASGRISSAALLACAAARGSASGVATAAIVLVAAIVLLLPLIALGVGRSAVGRWRCWRSSD